MPHYTDLFPSGVVLFKDDFSNPTSRWKQSNTKQGSSTFTSGAYQMTVRQFDTQIWSNPGLNFTNVQVEAKVTKIEGADNNLFGLICRYQKNANFYAFVISSDGYYGILKYQGGDLRMPEVKTLHPIELIKQGTASNQLRFDCQENRLVGYINGEFATQMQDDDFSSGDVGLIAGTLAIPETVIQFDNFIVIKPQIAE